MQVKSRHHLRSDAVSDLEAELEDKLGVSPDGDAYERVEFEEAEREVILIDGEPQIAFFDEEPFVTVRGANAYEPEKRVVTVDAGAVSFVSDGADIMRPGITEATPDISPDDFVVIAEESHGKVLAVGRARVEGADMVGDEGKVVDSVHHVGDELFEFTG
ncbi:RNA-binding protein [Natrinema halophilum]|uniref:RNA-binding protein n=1 Tax=Natrinema halophilum TaxID=1699371 RepID=A0A7D5KJ27_9EURY|nr:RNA-binding protein [Natrinema halophilum]QLG49079.1 RNA-binding protein [Natrinema halophilum]